jgi:hypothetical protein
MNKKPRRSGRVLYATMSGYHPRDSHMWQGPALPSTPERIHATWHYPEPRPILLASLYHQSRNYLLFIDLQQSLKHLHQADVSRYVLHNDLSTSSGKSTLLSHIHHSNLSATSPGILQPQPFAALSDDIDRRSRIQFNLVAQPPNDGIKRS